MTTPVIIIGAGLAGTEAAWQIARSGIPVELFEMRPERMTPAHSGGQLGELVCSNSLRGTGMHNAVGLLKEELRRCNSLFIEAADTHAPLIGGYQPWLVGGMARRCQEDGRPPGQRETCGLHRPWFSRPTSLHPKRWRG